MQTRDGLAEMHGHAHAILDRLLDHCDGFAQADLERELDGFGYPSVLLQLYHVIGAEAYWLGVLRGLMLVDEDEADHASVAALRSFRDRVVADTKAYLDATDDAALNAPCTVDTWSAKGVEVIPANVILRTQTHAFQHKGQIGAMCRLLGRPVPSGLDYPVS